MVTLNTGPSPALQGSPPEELLPLPPDELEPPSDELEPPSDELELPLVPELEPLLVPSEEPGPVSVPVLLAVSSTLVVPVMVVVGPVMVVVGPVMVVPVMVVPVIVADWVVDPLLPSSGGAAESPHPSTSGANRPRP
ncbi:MAG: hypothetical protein KDK70_37980 [Myxococcales bacterium]|nr:hypothetical protein [Myxococcales bacterium]